MGYKYTCDGCGTKGTTPALMGQFSEKIWLSTPLGDQLKKRGYELGDTITFCPDCVRSYLR